MVSMQQDHHSPLCSSIGRLFGLSKIPEVLPPGTYGASFGGKPSGNGSFGCGSTVAGGRDGAFAGASGVGKGSLGGETRGTLAEKEAQVVRPPATTAKPGLSQGLCLGSIMTGTTLGPSGAAVAGANQPGLGGAPARGCFAGSQFALSK